jgi:pimeloyl-ACP methyl ester carboxylesterase
MAFQYCCSMIQGLSDYCDSPNESEGLEGFFTGGYRRVVLENVGHFPHREASRLVADAVLHHFHQSIKPDSL